MNRLGGNVKEDRGYLNERCSHVEDILGDEMYTEEL